MSLGWIEGLQVSSVCKEQNASSPTKKSLLYCYLCFYLCTYVFICVRARKLWRGVCGVISAVKASLDTFSELQSMRLHISKTQLCAKEHIDVYSVVRSAISLLINESLDF